LRVAIIGAGPCGLACALELEQRNIYPDLYEQSYRVGYNVPMVQALLRVLDRQGYRHLRHIFTKLGFNFKPLANLHTLTIRTSRRSYELRGDLGILLERGQGEKALEVQLSKQLRSAVKFGTSAGYNSLAGAYDYVVVCDGNSNTAVELKIVEKTYSAWLKGAVLLGDYDPGTATLFFNTCCAGRGHACLLPFSRERAMLLLLVTGASRDEMEDYWKDFLYRTKLEPEIVQAFEIQHLGLLLSKQRVGNILLAGNSGGFSDSLLGLDSLSGMASGALAGIAIAENMDYDRLVEPIVSRMRRLAAFRDILDTLDSSGIDRLIRVATLPGIKQVLSNSNIDILSLLYPLVKKRPAKSFQA